LAFIIIYAVYKISLSHTHIQLFVVKISFKFKFSTIMIIVIWSFDVFMEQGRHECQAMQTPPPPPATIEISDNKKF
jgi:hypothetical protein